MRGEPPVRSRRLSCRPRQRGQSTGRQIRPAELHRLRGDVLSRLPSADWTEVERCFRRALAVAREHGSRGFELRAAVSLARLLCAQQRQDEARNLLGPIFDWFTEGLDTPDLAEAKSLLNELR
jgi:predicted ATPase